MKKENAGNQGLTVRNFTDAPFLVFVDAEVGEAGHLVRCQEGVTLSRSSVARIDIERVPFVGPIR